MPDYEKAVFVSYAWNDESEEMVDQIEQSLQARGIRIVRDKRDLGYKGLIGKFMERLGRGTCVIVVISDNYLRSPNCMFELVEIADAKQFHDRIFPVILKDADIYDPIKRIEYVRYWEVKRNELAAAMRTLDPANLHGIREEMDLYDRIRDRISGIASTLKDIEERLKGGFPPPPDADRQESKPATGAPPDVQYFEPITALVPEGPFLMGSLEPNGAPGHELPQHMTRLLSCGM
jgi:hypothetical protein